MTIKLCNINHVHCLHNNFVVFIYIINDKIKKLLCFLLTITLPCASVVRESRRLVPYIRDWRLLLVVTLCFLETNPWYLHFLAPQKNCNSTSALSSCVSYATCVGVDLQIFSPSTLMSLDCNGVVMFLSPWNSSIKS
jgi:hypothetical protein